MRYLSLTEQKREDIIQLLFELDHGSEFFKDFKLKPYISPIGNEYIYNIQITGENIDLILYKDSVDIQKRGVPTKKDNHILDVVRKHYPNRSGFTPLAFLGLGLGSGICSYYFNETNDDNMSLMFGLFSSFLIATSLISAVYGLFKSTPKHWDKSDGLEKILIESKNI